MKAVRPYTIKGQLLCFLIEILCLPLFLIKGRKWQRARQFEENPRTMKWRDIVYFAYKYYFKSPLLADDSSIDHHFSGEKMKSIELTDTVTVNIGGDLMPYELIKPEFSAKLWDEVGDEFFGSDLVFANLETPLNAQKRPSFVPEVMLNHMLFNTDEQTFSIFSGNGRYKGYDVLSIANNHSLDMGVDGLNATIDFLRARGIDCPGAKRTQDDKPYSISEMNGIKIAFLAFTYSLNEFSNPDASEAERVSQKVNLLGLNLSDPDISPLIEQVAQCREEGADFIICSLHCGNAYQIFPSYVTVKLFNRIFNETGVDVIAGGHPHNLQPWRYYDFKDPLTSKMKRGFAIYSLADFIAYDIYTWCHLCAMLKLEIGRDAAGHLSFNAKVVPLVMSRVGGHLQLKYADAYFERAEDSSEKRDLKVLYDACMSLSSHSI